ncbi:MAG: methionyl-tRNA formyltransferase [Opitutales bacterium]|nr:methionyl-tRNA formyltransferase [Opitutales bacterium]
MACNVVFFGSHEVAIPILDYLFSRPEVILSHIVSQPDRASGRGKILKPTAISAWALDHSINLLRPSKPDMELAAALGTCDLILVMAYGHILREHILSLPRLGIFNFHASILPKYRGASPVETALACGEQLTGVSLMEVIPQMDAGDVVDTEIIAISPDDYAPDLYDKLAQGSVHLLDRQLGNLINGNIVKHPQDAQAATYTRKIMKQDGQIDYNLSVIEIFNRIRGFHAHVGTFTKLHDTVLNIGHCKILDTDKIFTQPGQILSIDKSDILISTKQGILAVSELQRPGGKLLKIREFINGFSLNIGDIFESAHAENIVSNQPFPWRR